MTSNAGSWIWRKLIKYRDQAKDYHRVEVRCGANASFWFDHWSSLGRLHDSLGARGCIDMGIKLTATMADVFVSHRARRHQIDMLNDIEAEIAKAKEKGYVDSDISLWKSKEAKFKTSFSTKDTWNLLRDESPAKEWYHGVWFSHATPKYSFVTWLAAHNRLSTGDRMLAWNRDVNPTCVLCTTTLESRDHLFFSCSFSAQIWSNVSSGILQQRYTSQFAAVLNAISGMDFSKTRRFILRYVFQASLYLLWRERNQQRHGEPPKPHSLVIHEIDRLVRNRLSTLQHRGKFPDGLQEWFRLRP